MGAYDRDFHAWAMEQAELIRSRSANAIDWENVAEEIESLGRQQRSEFRNRLVVLLAHLLKWRFQPTMQTRSWEATIVHQRLNLADHLEENPSLRSAQDEVFLQAYRRARFEAAKETGVARSLFPIEPPFTLAQTLDVEWLPEALPDE